MSLSPPPIWEPPSWDDEDVAPKKPGWDVGRPKPGWDVDRPKPKLPNIGTHHTDHAMTITMITFGIVAIIVLLAVCIANHMEPVDLVCYIVRVIWDELVETVCWYWTLLVKLVRWICCVKTERPAPQQPQESGIELRASCPPPEDASFPPQREGSSHYQSSDSGLTTLREESSASSTHTMVRSSADTAVESSSCTAAASSSQTAVASA
ncbi:hypothetical protein ACHAPE_002448 [Trichoderma viride]